MLDEGDTFGINGSFVAPEKKFSINFSKATTKFCISLHYMVTIVTCLLTGKKSLSLKQIIKMSTFQISFVLAAYLINVVTEEVSLKGNAFDYDAIGKSDILTIHKYLMITNNIQWCSGLQNKYCVITFSWIFSN